MTRRTLCIAIFAVAMAVPARGEEIDRHFEHSFDVQKGAILHLLHGDGDVVIEPWDQDKIDVQVRYRHELKGWHISDERKFDVHFRQVGDHVYVEEQREGSTVLIVGASIQREYIYEIKAPAWVQLDLEGEDGDVEIQGWRTNVDLISDDGDVRLVDCRDGRFDLRLQDGDLLVDRSAGQFDVEMSDGDVDFRQVTTQQLQILVEDGSVDLDLLASGAVDWDIELDDGNLSLDFPAGIDAEIELETDDGRLRTSGFEQEGRHRESRLSAKLGDGSGRIVARSEDGDLTLRQRGDAP